MKLAKIYFLSQEYRSNNNYESHLLFGNSDNQTTETK